MDLGEKIGNLGRHAGRINSLVIDRGTDTVFSASDDTMVKQWKISDFSNKIDNPESVEPPALICANGEWGITRHRDNSIRVWDLETCQCIKSPMINAKLSTMTAFFEMKQLICGTDDGQILVYDLEKGEEFVST